MTQTKEGRRSQYTSPTSTAPVLIGDDGADGGRDALALGRELSALRGAPCLVAVPGHDSIASARAALGDPEAPVEEIGVTSSGRVLSRIAERDRAGTIVIGSSRRGTIGRAMLGSVGVQVLDHAPCEVVVAPRGYATTAPHRFRRIAVAVDGTEESKVALTRAEDLARQAGAELEILVSADPFVAGIQAEFPEDAPPSLAKVLDAAIASVDPDLSPTGKKVDPGRRQVARTIAAALAESCDSEADLLVTGSRRPMAHLLGESVTHHLIHEAPCPVLVVPHSREV